MLAPFLTSAVVLVLLGGYRLFWVRRYGRRGVDGSFTRMQGHIAGLPPTPDAAPRRPFELRLRGGCLCPIDPRSPWLRLVGPRLREGELVTVDGLPAPLLRSEALYREPSRTQGLLAMRIARGAWPEMRLLILPFLFAALIVLAILVPALFGLSGEALLERRPPVAEPTAAPEPQLPSLACPAGTRAAGESLTRWCETPDAVKHGPWARWELRNGLEAVLVESGELSRGKREGLWLSRSVWAGHLTRRARYRHDAPDGCWEEWDDGGAIRSRSCIKDGRLDGVSAVWEGGLRERGTYRGGLKHGLWEVWSKQGSLLRQGRYRDGKREGPWRFWNLDGGRAALGRYRQGVVDGLWTWWHETERLAGRGRYVMGRKRGVWRSWHPGGERQALREYRDCSTSRASSSCDPVREHVWPE